MIISYGHTDQLNNRTRFDKKRAPLGIAIRASGPAGDDGIPVSVIGQRGRLLT